MNKFTSSIILAAFTAVYSLGATAADTSDKNNNTAVNPTDDSLNKINKKKWEKEYGDSGKGDKSTSQIMQNEEAKDIPADEKYKFRDQETMNKKPYKEPK